MGCLKPSFLVGFIPSYSERGGHVILEMENLVCKRCGSGETKLEVLIPGMRMSPKGESEYSTEIFCKRCGKINRTTLKVSVK